MVPETMRRAMIAAVVLTVLNHSSQQLLAASEAFESERASCLHAHLFLAAQKQRDVCKRKKPDAVAFFLSRCGRLLAYSITLLYLNELV